MLGSDRSDVVRLDIDMPTLSGIEPLERSSQPDRSGGRVASEQPHVFDAAQMITSENYFTSATWPHAFERNWQPQSPAASEVTDFRTARETDNGYRLIRKGLTDSNAAKPAVDSGYSTINRLIDRLLG